MSDVEVQNQVPSLGVAGAAHRSTRTLGVALVPAHSRVLVAFLVAPLTAPAILVLLTILDRGDKPAGLWVAVLGVLYAGTLFSYLTAIVAGIPIYFLFKALRLRSVAWFAAVGAGVGAALIHLLLAYPAQNWYPAPVTYAIGALCGSASAAMFWLLGVKLATPNNALDQARGR